MVDLAVQNEECIGPFLSFCMQLPENAWCLCACYILALYLGQNWGTQMECDSPTGANVR